MQLLDTILAAIATLAVTGVAQAQAVDHTFSRDALPRVGAEPPGVFSASSVSMPHSSFDSLERTAAVEFRTSIAGATRPDLATMPARPARVLDRPLGSEPDDAGRSGSGVAKPERGLLFSSATVPEPTDRMVLLCGLLVAAVIARRKVSWTSN